MSGHHLSIDYGTSNTVSAMRWPDGRTRPLLFDGAPALPSAVFRQPNGALLTGRDAVHSARLDPASYEPNPKRRIDEGALLLGDATVTVVEAIAATLRRVTGEAARAAGGPPASVVLTYPAGWGAVRRSVLAEASAAAGLPAPTLVPEPVAATAYFTAVLGHAVRPGHLLVVYDLGAGTFDISVVRRTGDGLEVRDVDGMADFGGLDLDGLVVGRVAAAVEPADPDTWRRLSAPRNAADRRHFRTLWDDARSAKEMLSREPHAGLHVPLMERDLLISRAEFEDAATAHLEAAAALTLNVMRRSGVTPENLAGVFLVGGASRVPLAATTLHRVTGVAPTVLEQPETVVAEGALHATSPPPTPPAPAVVSPPQPMSPPPIFAAPAPPTPAAPAVVSPPPMFAAPAPAPSSPSPPFPPQPVFAAPAPAVASRVLWNLLASALLLVPVLVAFLTDLPPIEVMVVALVFGIPAAVLFRNAATWRPSYGYGFARRRAGIGRVAVAVLVVGILSLSVLSSGIRFLLSHPSDISVGPFLIIAALTVTLLGIGGVLLFVYHRRYPRLIVHHAGLTYQPDARTVYELPWPELSRIDVTPAALVAYPESGSRLPHDPRYAGLWRDDQGAFTVAGLDRLLDRPRTDATRLADAVARHR